MWDTPAIVDRAKARSAHSTHQRTQPSSPFPLPVTVPGTVWGWDAVQRRFGKLTFKEVLAPAIEYADGGFPVSERIAADWILPKALPLRGCCTDLDQDSVKTWYVGGKPPTAGQVFRNPDLARTLRLLQQHGAQAFYTGDIASAIVAKSQALGGTMTLDDLSAYKGDWVEPVVTRHRGVDVAELPPPSQSWAANESLSILDACVPKWAPGQPTLCRVALVLQPEQLDHACSVVGAVHPA